MGLTCTAQCDTIYLRAGGQLPARISEISEELITYKKPESAPTHTLYTADVQKIRFKNGVIEQFKHSEKKTTTVHTPTPAKSINKLELTPEDKATIEKIVEKCGVKIARCALRSLRNCSSSVDWGITRRDVFNPGIIIIIMKVAYEQTVNTDIESFVVSLSLNETTKNITWKLLNSTNEADGIEILKCQKNSM